MFRFGLGLAGNCMNRFASVITVAFNPCWDITCTGSRIDWGEHQQIRSQTAEPAGKPMNVSKALHWLGTPNTAAGLWGQDDYSQMLKALRPMRSALRVAMTRVPGRTRQNITIVDEADSREMHLRAPSDLTSKNALKHLRADLHRLVRPLSMCVFGGSFPQGPLLPDVLAVMSTCKARGARLVVDTSGEPLSAVVALGDIEMLKPNVQELSELAGRPLSDTPPALAKAARQLLDRAGMVLVSRAAKGALLVTKRGVWQARCASARRKVHSTVACGDYLLAGFLKGLSAGSPPRKALEIAIRVATARAWGLTTRCSAAAAARQVRVITEPVT